MSALPTAWPSINSGVDARRFLDGVTDTVETKWENSTFGDKVVVVLSREDKGEIRLPES